MARFTQGDFEYQFEDMSREQCVMLAARSSLRVLPGLVLEIQDARKGQRARIRRDIVLPVFRANAVAWGAAFHTGGSIQTAALAAGTGASLAASESASSASSGDAAHAACQAIFNPDFVEWAAISAVEACDAGDHFGFGPGFSAAIFTEVGMDLADLGAGQSVARILHEPLWRENRSPWAEDNWKAMRRALLRTNEGWKIWIDWYERRLSGDPADEPLEISNFLQVEETHWSLGPAAVNERLYALQEAYLENLDDNSAKPIQRPSTFRFVVRDGVIGAEKFSGDLTQDDGAAFYDALRASTDQLVEATLNSNSGIVRIVNSRARDLKLILSVEIAKINAGELLALWDSFDSLSGVSKSTEGRTEVPLAVAFLVDEVLSRLAALSSLSPKVGEIIALRRALSLTEEDIQAFDTEQRRLVETSRRPEFVVVLDPSVSHALEAHEARKQEVLLAAAATSDLDAKARAHADATNIRKQQAIDAANFAAGTIEAIDQAALASRDKARWSDAVKRFNKRLAEILPEQSAEALADTISTTIKSTPAVAAAVLGAVLVPTFGALAGIIPALFRANNDRLKRATDLGEDEQ